jgi:hypothetical protein
MPGSELHAELEALNLEAARAAKGCVPLHAASIDTSAGVIALAGQSGAGKSTLAAAAVLAGFGYVADEISAVSPDDLLVRPFHRPIGLRQGGAEAIGVPYPEPSDGRFDMVYPWDVSGHGVLSPGGPLGGIVLVDRSGESSPSLAEVVPAQALAALSQHTVIPDDQLADGFAALERIVRSVPVVRMTYATTPQSLSLLEVLVERWSA